MNENCIRKIGGKCYYFGKNVTSGKYNVFELYTANFAPELIYVCNTLKELQDFYLKLGESKDD
jgi:hypothetical protein